VSRSCRNSNLNWIQTRLQIVKKFGKRKGISKSYSVMGRNLAHPGACPAHPLSFSFPRVTQPRPSGPAGLPPPFSLAAQCGPVACRSRAELVFLAETWPSRTHHAPTENPPRTNRNRIETSIGDSVRAVILLCTIEEQNPINRSIPCPRIEVFITKP
jgi:hypothetical protein